MRKFFINLIAFGLIGGVMGRNGIDVTSPSFWIILVAAMIIQFNNRSD